MNVLLATDGSQYAARAEQLVASLPWLAGTRIQVVRVDQGSTIPTSRVTDAHARAAKEARQQASAQLERVKATLARAGVQVETTLVDGRPASVLVELAERSKADLIVMGSRGRGFLASTFLGSVAAEVVDHAPCPVLVARHSSVSSVVLADDGSEGARRAAEAFVGLGVLKGKPVQLVSVADLSPLYMSADPTGMGGLAWSQELVDGLVHDQEEVAKEGAARLASLGVTASVKVRSGYVAQELMSAAAQANADLIVIGSRGNTGLRRALLGSVARNVLLQAPCSVLIVHPTHSA